MKKFICFACMIMMITTIFAFSGCKKMAPLPDTETYKFVSPNSSVKQDSLGDIKIEGDFYRCNAKNLLRLHGCYRGNDFITFEFGPSLPISKDNVELFQFDQNSDCEGILYKQKDEKKYITLKYPSSKSVNEGSVPSKDSFCFGTVPNKSRSYYEITIALGDDPSQNYEYEVAKYKQTGTVQPYSEICVAKYDYERETYSKENDSWEHVKETDCTEFWAYDPPSVFGE